jgi:hypothetical protein
MQHERAKFFMKLLFFSPDDSEVALASKECAQAGIPCEVRSSPTLLEGTPTIPQTELWIKDDSDSHRALMLCVSLGVGFTKRTNKDAIIDI